MRGIKIPPQHFALKMQGGHTLYLWDTTVYLRLCIWGTVCAITFNCAEVKIDTRLDESSLLTRGSMW